MTAQGVLLVAAVVWAVSLIRSVRLRALVASLPLPMTAALLATGYSVGGAHLVGVVGLNLFFGVVALTHHRLRWPILLADVAGVAGYVVLAAALRPFTVPFGPALAATVGLWLLTMLVLRRHTPAGPPVGGRPLHAGHPAASAAPPAGGDVGRPVEPSGPRRPVPAVAKLLLILGGAALSGLLGQLLRGLVVTFPYAGVLVAVEVRRDLPTFTRHFARNSLALVGFLVGVHAGQDAGLPAGLAAGWAGFALVAAAVHLPQLWHGKRRPGAVTATGCAPRLINDDEKRDVLSGRADARATR
ncbi:hypothetical protein ACFOOK_04295 [Micromonospora krabiensis]|uniref:Uncharacterized protein n=1 Tax=Micromonospora krabiensis TaxID=307121 RepID=A0A1C3NDW9_9ACTN|nr:hypothetical protein [Micromonospora krabiensis]SBV30787.1 hypothetical protein GA0070620_6389 [Micromonospora krabiensis]